MATSEERRAARAASDAARKQRAADQARKVALRRTVEAERKQQAELRKQRDELRKVEYMLKRSEATVRQSARAGAASVVTGRYAGRLPKNVRRVAARNSVSALAAIRTAVEQVGKELARSMETERSIRQQLRDAK